MLISPDGIHHRAQVALQIVLSTTRKAEAGRLDSLRRFVAGTVIGETNRVAVFPHHREAVGGERHPWSRRIGIKNVLAQSRRAGILARDANQAAGRVVGVKQLTAVSGQFCAARLLTG